ncbi:putative quinol monooxygenase [Nonomuraea africana]|uniref:Quinol monooxygenase YgiN n=1 Tax=Nonomuraea africana TaxID=46171 RepID=A0ABR9KS89_9ACTN|nr:antibiotic biosynthesis monooxygenase [Nonomuraea africana]MBE1564902.1 quinol monooxygenase YgiN [Nonomuraea africana]
MELLVAVIAFAGALLAGIAAYALVRRLQEEREGWLIAWTVAAVALCVSLAVIGLGGLTSFGALTFRLYQLFGALLAPLWLAIGLIQLLAEKGRVSFATWLLGTATTIVATYIVVLDPIRDEAKFQTETLPAASHWGLVAGAVLTGVHALVVLVMLGCLAVAGLRWRKGDEYDTDNMHAALVIAPSGIALVGAVRFSVPAVFTVALLLVAAAAVWYAVLRPLAPYDDEEDEIDDEAWETRPSGRRAVQEPAQAPAPAQPRRSGLGDLVAEYRAGEQEIDYAARMSPASDAFAAGPATGYVMSANGADAPLPQSGPQSNGYHTGTHPSGAHPSGAHQGGGPQTGPHGIPQPQAPQAAPETGMFGVPDGLAASQGYGRAAREPEYGMPGTGSLYPGAEIYPGAESPAFGTGAHTAPAVGTSRPSPNIYGLLTVFTIMDGSGDAFDRLAEETVDAVRRSEPDTLVYACHAVKSAPLQRIVYELYRDEVAYVDHQRQPHVERFLTERQSMVLATNVIELNVNAAKVVPLPTAFQL